MTIKTTFWQEYLKRSKDNASSLSLKECEKIMTNGKQELEEAIGVFRQKLSKVPTFLDLQPNFRELSHRSKQLSSQTAQLFFFGAY